MGKLGISSNLNEFLTDTECKWLDDNIKLQIFCPMESLCRKFFTYFLDRERDNLASIGNSYVAADKDVVNMFDGNDGAKKNSQLKMDSKEEDAFKDKTSPRFWIANVFLYTKVASTTIRPMIPFQSTNRSEAGFFALLDITSKMRNKQAVEADRRGA